MPFRDDPTKRPLFDTLEGGGPRAWECKIMVQHCSDNPGEYNLECKCGGLRGQSSCMFPDKVCGKICMTLDGLRRHQKMVHNFEEQQEIQNDEESSGQKSDDVRNVGDQSGIRKCETGSTHSGLDSETLPDNGISLPKDNGQ